jgi:hypothetical protein
MIHSSRKEKREFPLAAVTQPLIKSIGVSSRLVMGSQAEVIVSALVLGEDDPVPRHAPRGGAVMEPAQHELMREPLRP